MREQAHSQLLQSLQCWNVGTTWRFCGSTCSNQSAVRVVSSSSRSVALWRDSCSAHADRNTRYGGKTSNKALMQLHRDAHGAPHLSETSLIPMQDARKHQKELTPTHT